jgi:hypothetical protein
VGNWQFVAAQLANSAHWIAADQQRDDARRKSRFSDPNQWTGAGEVRFRTMG